MKKLLYNVNPILAFELRRLSDFDFYVKDKSFWNHNIRPFPKNFTEVFDVVESDYSVVVSEDFTGFEFQNIRRIDALNIPYLSYQHYHYGNKTHKGFCAGGNYGFTTEDEFKLFLKITTNLNITFIGPKTGLVHNTELPSVLESTEKNLYKASVERFYKLQETLGSYISYVNVIKDVINYNVYEAMLLGLPVVSVKFDEDLKHGQTGLYSDDPYELRSYITHLLQKPDIAVKMGANARRYAVERFKKSNFHKEWRKVLG